MRCRPGCGACCIAPSINSSFHGMPRGKAAGVPCAHLDESMRCGLFGDSRRPAFCGSFTAEPAFCGEDREQALVILQALEATTGQRDVPREGGS